MDVDVPMNCDIEMNSVGSDEDMFADSQECGSSKKSENNECSLMESMEPGPSRQEDDSSNTG